MTESPAAVPTTTIGRRTRSRRVRLAAAFAGAAIGVGLLAGCAGTPGAAATVGEVTISDQTITDGVAQLRADAGLSDSGVVPSLLGRLIVMELVNQVAAQHDVVVTDGQVAQQMASYEEQVGDKDSVYQLFAQQGVPQSQVDNMLRLAVQVTALGPILKPAGTADEQTMAVVEAVTALGEDVGVTVNPRWGTWDPATLNIGAPADDLSTLPGAPVVAGAS